MKQRIWGIVAVMMVLGLASSALAVGDKIVVAHQGV